MLIEPTSKTALSLLYCLNRSDNDPNLDASQTTGIQSHLSKKLSLDHSFDLKIKKVTLNLSLIGAIELYRAAPDVDNEFLEVWDKSKEELICMKLSEIAAGETNYLIPIDKFKFTPSKSKVLDSVIIDFTFPNFKSAESEAIRMLQRIDVFQKSVSSDADLLNIKRFGFNASISAFVTMANETEVAFENLDELIKFNDQEQSSEFSESVMFSDRDPCLVNKDMFIDNNKHLENTYSKFVSRFKSRNNNPSDSGLSL